MTKPEDDSLREAARGLGKVMKDTINKAVEDAVQRSPALDRAATLTLAEDCLREFVQAINDDHNGVWLEDDDGGNDVCAFPDGGLWRTGAAYMNACDLLGVLPIAHVPCASQEWDGQEALDVWNRAKSEGRLRTE